MDYFLAHILPLLPQGLFQQTARVLVDKTLTYISEGLPQDKRAEPWRSLHLIEGYDAAGALPGFHCLHVDCFGSHPQMIKNCDSLRVVTRAYLEVATTTGPDYNELVWPRVIEYKKA